MRMSYPAVSASLKADVIATGMALLLGLSAVAADTDGSDRNASPGGWRLSLGTSYRSFGDIDFSAADFRNFGTQGTGTLSIGPTDTPANRAAAENNGPYGIQNIDTALLAPNVTNFEGQEYGFGNDLLIPVDYARFNGESDDGGEQWGVVLGASREIGAWSRGKFILKSNFQYYRVHNSYTYNGTMANPTLAFTAEQYLHSLVDVDPITPDGVVIPAINPMQPADQVPALQGTADTSFAIDNDFDLQLVVIDIGLEASLRVEGLHLDIGLAAGPTISVSDFDTHQELSTRWAQNTENVGASQITIPANTHRERPAESSTEIGLGGYVALSLSWEIAERWGLSGGIRYDVAGEIDTDQMKMDLDGCSANLQLSWRF